MRRPTTRWPRRPPWRPSSWPSRGSRCPDSSRASPGRSPRTAGSAGRPRRLPARPVSGPTRPPPPRPTGPGPPSRRRRPPGAPGRRPRRSAATSRAGAGAARSTSSAMAPPEPAAERPDPAVELEALSVRLKEAERYLRLDELRSRRAELEAEAARPDLWDDADRARAVTTELGRVSDDVERFGALVAALEDAKVLRELVDEAQADASPDPGLEAELATTVAELERRVSQLELQSLFSGEYDDRDAVAEVHAGAGGTDAQDWAEMMLRMYQRWAERRGFSVEVDEATPGQEAGLLSATFIVHGRFAYGLLAAERGVHRLVRMSPFDSQRRRQTSFASLDVVPFLDDVADEVDIDEKELRVDTYRSSGAGGQHVNKTDSAVRITHLPTGIVVAVQNERSQHQNRAKAMQILAAKLHELRRQERQAELDSERGDRADAAWGNQIRSYVLAPYQMVKDLRTGVETGNVDAVLDGDLDPFMEAELRRRRGAGTA